MLRALPAMVRTTASMSAAVRSGVLVLATSSSCSRVTVPTLSVLGLLLPLSMPTALRNSTEAGIASAGFQSAGDSGLWEVDLFVQDQDFANFFGSASLDRTSERPTLDQFDVPSESLGLSGRWSHRVGSHLLSAGGDVQLIEGSNTERFLWTGSDFARQRSAGGERSHSPISHFHSLLYE